MLVTVLDKGTYLVGTKSFSVGQKIDLKEVAGTIIAGHGFSTVEINELMLSLYKKIGDMRETFINAVHRTEEPYKEELAQMGVEFEALQRDYLYWGDVLYKAVQTHVGGMLPVDRNPDTGEMTVRGQDQGEPVNYLKNLCAQLSGFNRFASARLLAMAIMGVKTANELPPANLTLDTKYLPTTLYPVATAVEEPQAQSTKEVCEHIAQHASGFYRDLVSAAAAGLIVWHTPKGFHVFDVKEKLRGLRQQPMPPKVTVPMGIRDMMSAFEKPTKITIALLGSLAFVEKGLNGILVTTIGKDDEYHVAISVDPTGAVKTVSSGAEPKIESALVQVAKTAIEEKK